MEKNVQQAQSSTVSVVDLWHALWRGKWIVGLLTSLGAFTAILATLYMPNVYYSEATVVASETDDISGMGDQLGGLASLAGLNLSSNGSNRHQIALEVLRSRHFIVNFVKRHELMVPLMAAESWDLATNELKLNPDIYDASKKQWVREVKPPLTQEPSDAEVFERFKSLMTVEHEPSTGVVKIGIEHVSPFLTQAWVENLVDDINWAMKQRDKEQAQRSISFLKLQLEENEYENLRNLFYGLIEEQLKTVMLAEASPEYVFTVIDPPVVNVFKSGPQRGLIVILVTLLSGLIASILVVSIFTARIKV